MKLAPVVLFVYNRPWHARQTIEALQKNELAKESELFIYSDGPKNEKAVFEVTKVRDYIKAVDGFRKVIIVERDCNLGLANNIIDGVTSIINNHGRVIVLEDDLITSPYFLTFMNEALDFYENEEKVMHISGWNYPIETAGVEETFLWRLMNCWGWATWKDRWSYFEKDVGRILNDFTRKDIKRFNLDGYSNIWSQVITNKKGKINTWALFWYASIFKQNGLCLNPTESFVHNIGHDGSGVHCVDYNVFKGDMSCKQQINFTENLVENQLCVDRIKRFYRLQKKTLIDSFINKIKNKIGRIIS